MSWISGDYELDENPAPPGSLAPPPPDVRREMLRLELEAQVANLQAEAGALAAEEAVEAGTTIAETDIGAALAAVNEAARSEAARTEPSSDGIDAAAAPAENPAAVETTDASAPARDAAAVSEDQSPA
jgi:hypothetical protein